MGQNTKSKVFFLHIPKTAGTSVTQVIDQHFHADEIFPYQTTLEIQSAPRIEDLPLSRPLGSYRLFRGHFRWSIFKKFESLTSGLQPFTFLRDPIRRYLSIYLHRRRDSIEAVADLPVQREISLAARQQTFKDFLLNKHLGPGHLQISMFLDRPAMAECEALETALERLQGIAMFGLTEAVSESLLLLNQTFHWKHTGPMPMLNSYSGPRLSLSSDELDLLLETTKIDREFYRRAQDIFWDRVDRLVGSEIDGEPLVLPASIGVDDALSGIGWYLREGGPAANHKMKWRWSGPGCHSRIDILLDRTQELRLEIAVFNVVSPDIHKTLEFSINGQVVASDQRNDDSGLLIYGINAPLGLVSRNGRVLRLGIHVAHTRSFHELNTAIDDHRPVGVAISRIDVLPRTPPILDRAKRWIGSA